MSATTRLRSYSENSIINGFLATARSLSADQAPLSLAGAGVGGTLAVVGFLGFPMRFGHDEQLRMNGHTIDK
jgi:hypothetical protein